MVFIEAKETTLENYLKAFPGTVSSRGVGHLVNVVYCGAVQCSAVQCCVVRATGSEGLLFTELLALCNS